MGASSSGLLDETKINHIKGLVDSAFQSFSEFYQQQYSAAYFGHLHQEVEPKKEGSGLLLTLRPQYVLEEVLYQGSIKFSCWDEQGKKCRERYIVLRRDYKVEIHENMETFSRGCAAKLVLQSAGGSVFTIEEESKAHLEQTCAGILNGVKEDSSSVVPSPDVLAVYLHLPYMGHTCFLFQQEEEQDNFLSALKTCIRHSNLDPWCDSSYESQAYVRAFQLYRQEKGSYESWEKLLGTEEQVLASQVMEEVLPWLQDQLQSRVKGKKTERIRQWLGTVQATYTLVLEKLTASLEALRKECHQTALANQALIRSNLDQIMSSHCFLKDKVRVCICEEAEKVCNESVAPYMSSMLEALTENISAGIQTMQRTLHTHMDSAFTHTNGGTEETKKALSPLRSISLDQCFMQVENLTGKLEDLKQRFGLSSTQRLVHSAHLEMEKLLGSAVYTFELFLLSSARLQPSQIPVKMERAKERVLKQLDYDSRVVQRRLYQEDLLEITLPALTRKMDSKWRSDLQQFEEHIFSDYSSYILVHNVYDDVLRNILSKEIETVVQDAASKKSNNLLLDTSDLAISQYSLLGPTPPRSAQGSPATAVRDSTARPSEDKESAPVVVVEDGGQTTPQSDPHLLPLSLAIVVTQHSDEAATEEASCVEETREVQLESDVPLTTESPTAEPPNCDSDAAFTHEVGTPDPDNPIPDSPDLSMPTLSALQSTDVSAAQIDPPAAAPPDLSASDRVTEDTPSVQHPCPSSSHPPRTDSPVKISLGSLSEAIGCNAAAPSVMQMTEQHSTDRAVYLSGEIKDNWELERVKEEKQIERIKEPQTEEGKEEEIQEEKGKEQMEAQSAGVDEGCRSTESPADSSTEQRESEGKLGDEEKCSELEMETRKDDEEEAEEKGVEKKGKKEKEEESPQPGGAAELPPDSVSIIRDLVSEITEVETVVSPCPNTHPDTLPGQLTD